MHVFYALVSFLMLNTLHLLMDTSTLSSMVGYNNWNEFINRAPNNQVQKPTSFGKTIDSNVYFKDKGGLLGHRLLHSSLETDVFKIKFAGSQ